MAEDIVRVLRIVEIVGPRSWVEKTVANSVHGTRHCGRGCEIRAVTIGAYPDALSLEMSEPDTMVPRGSYPEKS